MRVRQRLFGAVGASFVLVLVGSSVAAAEPGGDGRRGASTVDAGSQYAVDEVGERVGRLWKTPGYGKVVVDYDTASITVYWKGPPPTAVAAMTQEPVDGVRVRLADAKFSEQDLMAAGERVMKTERARLGKRTINAAVPTADMSGLVMEVAQGTAPALRSQAVATRYQQVAGMPVRVLVVEGFDVPLTRQNDSPPWQGGAAIANRAGNDYCSTGFAVLRGAQGRLLGAGHCNEVGDVVRDGVGQRIGVVSNKRRVGLDSLLIDPGSSPATIGEVYGGRWNARPGDARYDLHVGGAGTPLEGQRICTSGARSGEHCNLEIRRTGVPLDCEAGTDMCRGFRARRSYDHVAVAGGDSGGPMYVNRRDGRVGARGIISSARPGSQLPCGSTAEPTTCYATVSGVGIHRILDHWNARIEID